MSRVGSFTLGLASVGSLHTQAVQSSETDNSYREMEDEREEKGGFGQNTMSIKLMLLMRANKGVRSNLHI